MAKKKSFYVTTAIDYVNAAPHIGHAFEKTLADAIVRWHVLHGDSTWFLTGTDENAQKNEQAAKNEKMSTKQFVDQNAQAFKHLCTKLDISYNRFIRTTDSDHVQNAQTLFEKAHKKGDVYLGNYSGLYCTGCEAYKTEKELVEGFCPEHGRKPEWMEEKAYFFKLSKYKKEIEQFVKKHVHPATRRNEILSRLKEEDLADLCLTRRGLTWGIDVPFDKQFKIYVWFDALINYLSGANGNWPADVHVIGKGINWFHSVIWPAMLISLEYELPNLVLVHGYLNLGGKKISKSLGNVIDPIALIDTYGSDSVRYALLRGSILEDADFSEEIVKERHTNELANKLGNLVSRVSALAEKYGLEKSTSTDLDISNTRKEVESYFETYELDKALSSLFAFLDTCNEYIQSKKPWETKDTKVLYELVQAIKDATILLSVFIPQTASKIAQTFGFELALTQVGKPLSISPVKKSEILFKKLD